MSNQQLSRTTMIRFFGHGLAIHALAALAWAACTPVWAGTLEGTAAYRERIALAPDAVFEAVLQDVSRADAQAEVLGRATIDPAGQPPFRFQIAYDAAVQSGRRYVVRATVRHQGRLLFTTDRTYPARRWRRCAAQAAARIHGRWTASITACTQRRALGADWNVCIHGRCRNDHSMRRQPAAAGSDGGGLQSP